MEYIFYDTFPYIFPERNSIVEYYFAIRDTWRSRTQLLGRAMRRTRVDADAESFRRELQQRTIQLLPRARSAEFFMGFIYFYGEDSSFYRDLLVGARLGLKMSNAPS